MLRVGVLLDSGESFAWIAKILERLRESEFARLEVALLLSSSQDHKSGGSLDSVLFRLYERWDYRRRQDENDPFSPTDLSAFLKETKTVVLDNPGNLPAGLNLDVLLLLTKQKLSIDLSDYARFGSWTIEIGDSANYLPGASCFWSMYRQSPTTDCMLLIRGKETACTSLAYSSASGTEPWSLYGNRRMIYWKAGEIILRCLRKLHIHGLEYIRSLAVQDAVGKDGLCKSLPGNLQMLAFGARYFRHWSHTKIARLSPWPEYKWNLALRRRLPHSRFDDPGEYALLPCPNDRFYADPFLFEKGGQTFLFFEDFRYDEGRAHISYCAINPDGSTSEPIEVLTPPFHLSYPFIFEDEGTIFMVPESRSSRNVVLYRATDFPATWVQESVLLEDVHAVDATIHKENGKYWMFAGVSDGRYSNSDELSLFFAETLKGPWEPHPGNPLISDVRQARPAGALFYHDGRLIRPSQDCSKAYGYGLVFSEVIKLTETEYEERPIASLYPESIRGCIANHTYNRSSRFEVIDRFLSRKAF